MSKKLLIVNYHYFREETLKKGIYPVTQKKFESDIDILSRKFKFTDIDNALYENKDSVLITFDDGLEEQMIAYDILYKKGINGIFFVSTNLI